MAEEAVATPVGNGAADGKPKKSIAQLPTALRSIRNHHSAVIATWFIPGRLFPGRLRRRLGRVPDHRGPMARSYYWRARQGISFRPRTRRHGDRCQSVLNGAITEPFLFSTTPSSSLSPWVLPRLHLDGQWHYQRR